MTNRVDYGIIRKDQIMREMNQWTQEEVAEKLGMSTTGYAKIERGQTNVSVEN